MPTTAPAVDTPWMTRREAAAYCRVSLETFDRWVKDSAVPKRKAAGTQSVRFHRDDLDALMIPVQPDRA